MSDSLSDIYAAGVAKGRLTPDPAQQAAIPLFDALADGLRKLPRKKGLLAGLRGGKSANGPRGLYLWGGVGRGKSMLMDMFFEAAPIEAKRRVHFHAFMQEVQAGIAAARKEGLDDAIAPIAAQIAEDARLLCFDEMQITDIADAMIVGRLFEKLFEAGVVVVTTSNRPPDDLYKDGLNRQLFLPFIALLTARMDVHELVAQTDYRQGRLAGEQVYFTPVNAAARDAIDAIWTSLTGGEADPLDLTVNGRTVQIPQFRNGVGRVSFWELCSKPLGPADYLAIAAAVRVLVLEDIPLLSRENYNEARRFVILIDALYEARVRLIASAAAVPDRLYVEGEGTFEFERTASRLVEMSSDGWG